MMKYQWFNVWHMYWNVYNYLESIGHYPVLLRPQTKKPENMITGNKWKIVPNVEIEADI